MLKDYEFQIKFKTDDDGNPCKFLVHVRPSGCGSFYQLDGPEDLAFSINTDNGIAFGDLSRLKEVSFGISKWMDVLIGVHPDFC